MHVPIPAFGKRSRYLELIEHARDDVIDDGGIRDAVLANAPNAEHGFFAVPKVIE